MPAYDPGNCSIRWLAYFDLLGTSELIRVGKTTEVFAAYQDAFEQLARWKKRHAKVNHAWFSDTFILFSEDGSGESFAAIERVSRWFAFALLRREIPVRGALSCGEFYVDQSNSLYLGPALLEAYEWGENQDWIGFLLCPSSITQLAKLGLPVSERLNYIQCEVPLKKPPRTSVPAIGACILGNWMRWSNGKNVLLDKLEKMRARQSSTTVRRKYDHTIEFIIKHERKPIENR